MEEPVIDRGSPLTERFEVLINSETGEYTIEMGLIQMGHLYSVLKDLIERIENDEFSNGSNPDLNVYPIEDERDPLS